MNKKARLTHLLDEYEKSLFNVNGIKKKEYIGQIGEIIHKSKRINGANGTNYLYDIRFPDGQVWCCEREQLEFL